MLRYPLQIPHSAPVQGTLPALSCPPTSREAFPGQGTLPQLLVWTLNQHSLMELKRVWEYCSFDSLRALTWKTNEIVFQFS